MDIRVLLSIIATCIAVISYIPYLRDIWTGRTKPHAFSWFIWALLGYIAGVAQLSDGGGVGATIVLTTSTISLAISLYSLQKFGMQFITKSDWVVFFASISAIPLWIATKDPFYSILLVSFIDVVAFWPTMRKAYNFPYDETFSTHFLSTIKHILSMAAQQHYTFITLIYPASLAITTAVFVMELIVRRAQVRPAKVRKR